MFVLTHQLICSKRSLKLLLALALSSIRIDDLAQTIYLQRVEKTNSCLRVFSFYLTLRNACANKRSVLCNPNIIIMNERVHIIISIRAELGNFSNLSILANH